MIHFASVWLLLMLVQFSTGFRWIRLNARTVTSLNSDVNENPNADFIANPVNSVELQHDDEVVIDFDALSAESATQAFQPKTDISSMYVKGERKAPRQAKWFPMLLSPAALDGTLAGDVGFDPLGFSKDKPTLFRMREAEIKHSRLAMLAAAGWPLSELWHREIADTLGLESILASAGKAPSVLNGGLSNGWIIGSAAVALLIGGLLELKTMSEVRTCQL